MKEDMVRELSNKLGANTKDTIEEVFEKSLNHVTGDTSKLSDELILQELIAATKRKEIASSKPSKTLRLVAKPASQRISDVVM